MITWLASIAVLLLVIGVGGLIVVVAIFVTDNCEEDFRPRTNAWAIRIAFIACLCSIGSGCVILRDQKKSLAGTPFYLESDTVYFVRCQATVLKTCQIAVTLEDLQGNVHCILIKERLPDDANLVRKDGNDKLMVLADVRQETSKSRIEKK